MIIVFEIIFILSVIHYFFFLLGVYKGLLLVKQHKLGEVESKKIISVVVPFRNEEKNLENSLNSLNAQTYPKNFYEVIYVNDDSDDSSVRIIEEHDYNHNVKLLHLNKSGIERGFKKNAIEKAIEIARGEIIVTTDADCTHQSEWLSNISNNFDGSTGFISMPVKFYNENSILKKLQQIEFAGLVLTGAGLIGKGKPAICNGANIAYRKSAFKKVNGYEDNKNLSSGDDEFLMQKIFKDTDLNIKFLYNKETVVETHANNSVKEFFTQRKRWASKGFFYKNKFFVAKLFFIFCFFLSLIVTMLLSLFNTNYIFLLGIIFILKIMFEFQILREGETLLFEKLRFKHLLLAEILHPFYIVVMSFAGSLGGFVWKNRKLKR